MSQRFGEWKIWNGGPRPVGKDVEVQVQLSCETRSEARHKSVHPAQYYSWNHIELDDDIIAYREVRQPVVKKHCFGLNIDNVEDTEYRIYTYLDWNCGENFNIEVTETDGVMDWNSAKLVRV